jgi:RimJ/RimL family protein N-acetyltransferase
MTAILTPSSPLPAIGKWPAAELGYYVARSKWGTGIVTEAARAVVNHALHGLRLGFLTSGYFIDNPASGRVLDKLGFVEIARTDAHSIHSPDTRDQCS